LKTQNTIVSKLLGEHSSQFFVAFKATSAAFLAGYPKMPVEMEQNATDLREKVWQTSKQLL
jgi:hypothetical protein